MTKYDFIAPAMRAYLATYGAHFCKQLCEDAVSMMRDRNNGKLKPIDKETLKTMLADNGVELEHDTLYDAVFVHAMLTADYWESGIEDDAHLARAIKDYLDDADGYEGIAFHRWYCDCCHKGIVIDWEDYL